MTTQDAVNQPGADPVLGYSRVRVENAPGRSKLVHLPLQPEAVAMGVRDEVAEHYRLGEDDYAAQTTTLDYLVGAIAGCLAGTFGGRLAALGQQTLDGALTTEATGELVVTDGVIRLRSVDVRYAVALTEGVDQSRIRRAHETHARFCPAAVSVKDSILIRTQLTVTV